jgi:hypothetical protein
MASRFLVSGLLVAAITFNSASAVPITKRNPYTFVINNLYGDAIFELGEISYLANTKHPKAVLSATCEPSASTAAIPVTVIKTNVSSISKATLESVVASYLHVDDVFNTDFLDGLYISSPVKATLDASAIEYLASFNTSVILLDETVSAKDIATISIKTSAELPAGPFLATIGKDSVSLASVYRLYEDTYRTFLFGAYDTNDGQDNHSPLGVFLPKYWHNVIP